MQPAPAASLLADPETWSESQALIGLWLEQLRRKRSWIISAQLVAAHIPDWDFTHPTPWVRAQMARFQEAAYLECARSCHDAADHASLGDMHLVLETRDLPAGKPRAPGASVVQDFTWQTITRPTQRILSLDEGYAVITGNKDHPLSRELPEALRDQLKRGFVSAVVQGAWMLSNIPEAEQQGDAPIEFLARKMVQPAAPHLRALASRRISTSQERLRA